MEVYLPIVEVQINVILILFVSFIIGFLSGLFGVGGGFLGRLVLGIEDDKVKVFGATIF